MIRKIVFQNQKRRFIEGHVTINVLIERLREIRRQELKIDWRGGQKVTGVENWAALGGEITLTSQYDYPYKSDDLADYLSDLVDHEALEGPGGHMYNPGGRSFVWADPWGASPQHAVTGVSDHGLIKTTKSISWFSTRDIEEA